MAWIDWGLIIISLAFMVSVVHASKSYMRSVADFLSGGRTAGRYIISVSAGMAGVGAISIVGLFEINYIAGFAWTWWNFTMAFVFLILAVSGWVIYRFRQTRALTLAQFFEMRYSKKFRIFTGIMAFISGIINFGIFPSVGARFFIYFCGLPHSFSIYGLEVSTFALVMIMLLMTALYFVFTGGQVSVIITSFVQGLIVNIVILIIVLIFLFKFQWIQISEALQTTPENASLINPYHTSRIEDFNYWYFLIGIFNAFYGVLAWQGQQAYSCSAKSAHEAKMGNVMATWRGLPLNLMLLFIPIVAYTVMHHPDFLTQSENVKIVLEGVTSDTIKSQLTVPLVLTHFLPKGLMGAFAVAMLAWFISTHDSYLHSWGSILIQDVVMHVRKKKFTPQQHIRMLRIAIIGVAIFIFFFSLLFKQSEYIFLFFAITGAIFGGGAGAVIIGGLYWNRGTTSAAWCAMITGAVIAVGGIIIHQIINDFFINGMVFFFIAMVSSSIIYVVVSLFSKKDKFNMDKLLHRGKYVIKEETKIITAEPARGLKILGMGKEFTRGDKLIYIITYIWTFCWTAVFIIGTVYNLTQDVSDLVWLKFWHVYIWINIIMSVIVTIWFTIGGLHDLKFMFNRLGTMERDEKDNGTVLEKIYEDE